MRSFVILIFICVNGLFLKAQDSCDLKKHSANAEGENHFILTKYRPIYFIYGSIPSKLEFSFKSQLLKLWPLYFGYTQLMFWDLKNNSKPFRDINFNPEIFYRLSTHRSGFPTIDLGPLSHLSNGRDGMASRSFNSFYVQFNFDIPIHMSTMTLVARLSHKYSIEYNNKDINDYVGPLELGIKYSYLFSGILDFAQLSLRIFPGGIYAERWHKGGRELGLNLRLGGIDMNSLIYIQYYNGYAESMLNYNLYEKKLRIGITL